MLRLPAQAGAWTLFAWAAITVVWWPLTRLLAPARGFAVKWLPVVDIAFVVYGLATAAAVAVHLRRKRPVQVLAWLAVPPLAFEALRGGEILEGFVLDLSGYPWELALLHWLGNLAFLALVAGFALLLLSRSRRDSPPDGD